MPPPHIAFGVCDIGVDDDSMQHPHRVRIRLLGGAGAHAEQPRFRYGVEATPFSLSGDVLADGGHFPALNAAGGISMASGFTAGRGEKGAIWFSPPPAIDARISTDCSASQPRPRHNRRDAKGEAIFSRRALPP